MFPLKDGSVIEAGPSFLEGLLGINAGNVDELRRLAPQAPDDIGLDGLAMPYEEEFDL